MLVFTLFVSLFINLSVDWHQQIQKYNQLEESPESVWATTLLYHSSPADVQEEMIRLIDSDLVKSGLEGGNTLKESLLITNELYNNESILLLNLLLESEQAERENIYNRFYSKNEAGSLSVIIGKAKDGNVLNTADLNIERFQFHHFLISFYLSNNRLADNSFFEAFSDYWINRTSQSGGSEFRTQLLRATTIKSLYELNRFSQISRVYDSSDRYDYFPISSLLRNFFWGLDFAYYRLDQLDISLDIQRKYTIPISDYLNDQNGLNSIKVHNGTYLNRLGNYQEARTVFLSVLENSDQLSKPFQVSLYNNLSLVYFKTGEATEYVETQLKALELAKDLDSFSQQSEIYRNLHVFYRKYQNWDLANQYIEQAATFARDFGNKEHLIAIYISRAVFESFYLNDISTAHEMLNVAEDLLDDDTDARLKFRIMAERSVLFKSELKWLESKKIQNNILELAAAQSHTLMYLEALIELAYISFQLGEFDDVEQKLREFRTYDISILNFPKLVLAQTLRGKLYAVKGNYTDAEREFSTVSELVFERARNTSEHETGYWNIEPEYLELFESYADFLINSGNINEAINILDRVKTINDASLIDNPLIQAANLTDAELAREKRISQEMDQIRKRIFTAQGQERLSLQNQLAALSAQRRSLLNTQSQSLDRSNTKIWSLQRRLKQDQMLVHITEINSNYYLSKIDRGNISIDKIEIDNTNTELFRSATQSIITGRTNLNQLFEIGELLNIASIPDHIQSLIFIPDGYFHQLPLSVIPLSRPDSPHSYGSANYLIEKKDIYTLNSLNELLESQSKGVFEHDFAGFGVSDFKNFETSRNLVSLPKAPQEIDNILSGLNRFNSPISLTNENATTASFRNFAGNSKILHLATHSEVSESDPLFSRLHFYADAGNSDSGQLFAYELFNLNLNNQLVMLNSCESGGDRYLQGSGIMGINRALRYAGVQSLVLNAWSVNDQFAADFAELFYHYLNRGETKSRALQLAKIDFIRTKNANPHYWGPYTLNGNNRPLLNDSQSQGNGIILAAFLLIGVVVFRRNSLG